MSRVVHFEVHADDPARAIGFYRNVFNWEIKPFAGSPKEYWLCTTGPPDQPGINGGILPRPGPYAFVCTINVEQLEAALKKIAAHGGKQVLDTMTIPNIGRVAYCQDTEGNIFGIIEPAPGM